MSEEKTRKQDLRRRYTRQMLEKNLVLLLKEKPFEKITVKELCEKAAINRATFYAYYSDMHDIMEQIFENMKELMHQHVIRMNTNSPEQHREALIDYLRLMRENGQLYFLLVNAKGPDNFREQTWQTTKKIVLGKGSGDKFTDLKNEFLLAHETYGITAIIEHWMIKGMPLSEQDLADLIIENCMHQLHFK